VSSYGEGERLYPDATRDEQMEEAIAQFFAEFRQGGKMLPRYRRIFAKVRDFLTRLGNALRGLGFHSVESIFAKVESGEVGRRSVGNSSSGSQYETDYLTGGRGGARYARGPVDMERADVPVHPRLFAKLAVPAHRVRADYRWLYITDDLEVRAPGKSGEGGPAHLRSPLKRLYAAPACSPTSPRTPCATTRRWSIGR